MEPNQTAETFWMLLSLLCLPVDRQIEIIGDIPKGDFADGKVDFVNNPASQLIDTMIQYYNGWWDEFEPNVENAEKLFRMIDGGTCFGFTENDFVSGQSWNKLRELAKAALDEAKMEFWPVPDKIDFSDYIEIVQPE
jgi:hypothetical protein